MWLAEATQLVGSPEPWFEPRKNSGVLTLPGYPDVMHIVSLAYNKYLINDRYYCSLFSEGCLVQKEWHESAWAVRLG